MSGVMDPKHKEILVKNHLLLVKQLDLISTHLLDYLYTDGIVSINDIQELEAMAVTTERASHFLRMMLPRRGPKAFEKFIRALVREGQELVAAQLDADLAKKCEQELESEDEVDSKHGTKKTLLKDNHINLVLHLDLNNSDLADVLKQEGVLHDTSYERLEAIKVPWKRTRYFLVNILPTCGPNAIDTFIRSLEQTDGQKDIAETLKKYLASPDQPDAGRISREFLTDEKIIALLGDADTEAFRQPQTVLRDSAEQAMKQNAYKMSAKFRGRAVIINNRYFVKSKDRAGAERDLASLDQLFTNLHFEVIPHTNLAAQEIKDVVQQESKMDHSSYDCFILFILTHGQNGYVLGNDDERVKIDDIVAKIGSCESLHNKPKMFFFQACRNDPNVPKPTPTKGAGGDSRDDVYVEGPKISYDSSSGMTMKRTLKSSDQSDAEPNDDPKVSLASCKDIFIAYSTVPGFYSYRNADTGSWFVRYFVYICSTRAHDEDIQTMMIYVNRLLSQRPNAVQYEQMGETIVRGLSRKIYFFPNCHD